MMRAAVYYGPRDIRVESRPIPEPGPGELLLRVHANGICGTDASEYASTPQMYPLYARHALTGHEGPIIPGHEFTGRVAAIGSDVTGFELDDLIVTGAALWCGRCPQCLAGRTGICALYATVGLHRDGGLAQYVCVPARIAFRADALNLGEDVAALTQPMAIAVHALRRGAPRHGEHVLVVGTGGIGIFLTYALVQSGAHVVAVDAQAGRLAIAERFGARTTIHAHDAVSITAPLAAYGIAPTLVFEVTGTQSGYEAAVAVVDAGGRIVTVGIAKGRLSVDARRITVKELELRGTNALIGDDDVPEAARLLSIAQHRWTEVAPVAIPLERLVADGLEPLVAGRSPYIKTLVDPWIETERATTA